MRPTLLFLIVPCLYSLIQYLGLLQARVSFGRGVIILFACAVAVLKMPKVFRLAAFASLIPYFILYCIKDYSLGEYTFIKVLYYAFAGCLVYVVPLLFTSFLFVPQDYKRCRFFLLFTLAIITLSSLITLRADVGASRILAGNVYGMGYDTRAQAVEYAESGVVGYAFVHTIPFVGIGLMAVFRGRSRAVFRYAALALNLLLFATIYRTGYSTAILMYATFMVFSLIKAKNFTISFLGGGFALGIVAIMWKLGAILALLLLIRPYIDEGNHFASKIDALAEARQSHQGSQYVDGRWELYQQSWEGFLENPIFGDMRGKSGGHSAMLDSLSHYGLVGTFISLLPLVLGFKLLYSVLPRRSHWYLHIAAVGLLVCYCLKASALAWQIYAIVTVLPCLLGFEREDYLSISARVRQRLGIARLYR